DIGCAACGPWAILGSRARISQPVTQSLTMRSSLLSANGLGGRLNDGFCLLLVDTPCRQKGLRCFGNGDHILAVIVPNTSRRRACTRDELVNAATVLVHYIPGSSARALVTVIGHTVAVAV